METQPQPTSERPRPTWTQCTIVIFVTLAAGVIMYLWRPFLLAPPRLELTWLLYLLFAMAWFPALIVSILLRPTGSTRTTLWQVIAGFVLSALLCSIFPSTPFPMGSMLVPQLDCQQEALDNNRVRYTCTADRMVYADIYTLEGAEGSPFVQVISVETLNR